MSSTLPITHLKLDWLRKRRDELRARYDAIAARVAAADDPHARLAALRDGLAELRAGAERLHPEAEVLEDVLPLGATTLARSSSLQGWTARLEQELAWGRARAEYGWVFAGLIEEWVATEATERPRTTGTPITGIAAPFDLAVIDSLASGSPAWQALVATIAEDIADDLGDPVDSGEVHSSLGNIADGPYRARAVRREARQVQRDDTMSGEYTGAVALMLDGMTSWRWPAAGMASRVTLALDKHRTYLEPELLEAVFTDVVGDRWLSILFSGFMARSRAHDEHLLDQRDDTPYSRAGLDAEVASTIDEAGTMSDFHTLKNDAGSSHYVSADAVFDGADAPEEWLARIDARIRGLHAVDPARPVFVVTTDIAALGPSVPHEVLGRLAELLGVPAPWRDFLARYLAVPVRAADGTVAIARRGVFPDERLALVFVEALLASIAGRVDEVTGVRAVRLVDDFAFVGADPDKLARAWALFEELVAGAGLTRSRDKTRGMVVFGEAHLDAGLPSGVTAGPIRAGHLVLQRDGSWVIDRVAVEAARVATSARVREATSVFEAAHVFSDGVRTTLRRLSPFAPFGAAHVARVAAAIDTFYAGIVEDLVARLRARMPDVDTSTIPSGVWFWPRTAGGVGLFDPTSQLAGIVAWWHKQPSAAPLPTAPEALVGKSQPLARFIGRLQIQPRQPPFSTEVAGRIVDFVRRGLELRGEQSDDEQTPEQLHHDLSFYWQWVAALHGPTVLARFGTFRFVEASRMPFGAIVELGWLGPRQL